MSKNKVYVRSPNDVASVTEIYSATNTIPTTITDEQYGNVFMTSLYTIAGHDYGILNQFNFTDSSWFQLIGADIDHPFYLLHSFKTHSIFMADTARNRILEYRTYGYPAQLYKNISVTAGENIYKGYINGTSLIGIDVSNYVRIASINTSSNATYDRSLLWSLSSSCYFLQNALATDISCRDMNNCVIIGTISGEKFIAEYQKDSS